MSETDKVSLDEKRRRALTQVLTLVRTVYTPVHPISQNARIRPGDLERLHREFLAVQAHWDVAKEEYVRKDGTALDAFPPPFPRHTYSLQISGGIKVKIRWNWDLDSYLDASVTFSSAKPVHSQPVRYRIINGGPTPVDHTIELTNLYVVNDHVYPRLVQEQEDQFPADGTTPFIFELTVAKHTFRSPAFRREPADS